MNQHNVNIYSYKVGSAILEPTTWSNLTTLYGLLFDPDTKCCIKKVIPSPNGRSKSFVKCLLHLRIRKGIFSNTIIERSKYYHAIRCKIATFSLHE